MRLFVMLSRVPWPLEKGDKLRAYHQIRELAKKHEVVLCCVNDSPVDPNARKELESIVSRLEIFQLNKWSIRWNLGQAFFSHQPYQVRYFFQQKIARKIDRLIHEVKPDHIYCQLIRVAEYVKNHHHIPKTIDYMDAFSKGMERRIRTSSVFFRPIVRSEHKRLLAYENVVFEYFEHKTIISEQDKNLIYHASRKEIQVIPNGVDVDFFYPRESKKTTDVVFVGNMNYVPNIHAACYLVKDIFPELRKNKPDCHIRISGATPATEVKALAGKQVEITGWVADIRDAYASARVFVAPMQIGTGLQNKLLEAMAMGIPCVTSPLANNALAAVHQTHLLVANNTGEFVRHICYLLEHPKEAEAMAKRGRQFIRERYDWENTTKALDLLLQQNGKSSGLQNYTG